MWFFIRSFYWKECTNEKFINQKPDYIHANSRRGVWNLVEDAVDYKHSSARFYLTNEQGVYPVAPCGELEDIDLTKEAMR